MNIKLFLAALGLAFFLEGLFYAVLAGRLPRILAYVAMQKASALRLGGIMAMLIGFCILAASKYI